jgi:iron complex transport system ATP-binding protein
VETFALFMAADQVGFTPVSVIDFNEVCLTRGGRQILGPITWRVDEGQRWVILGPNGAGKTSLIAIAATLIHPTKGQARVLDELLGRVDVFELRHRIGLSSAALTDRIPPDECALDVVMTASWAVTGRWQEVYDLWDESRALGMLSLFGVSQNKDQKFGSMSEGERKRIQIARALMPDPELLILDEPAAGLDLGAREDLLTRLSGLAVDPAAPTSLLVTHHVEEIPSGTTHALLLRDGGVVAAGPINEVLTSANISQAFGLTIDLSHENGRWFARAL